MTRLSLINMKIFAIIILFLASTSGAFSDEGRILRYPNSSKTQITFCYAGDVYTAPIAGGLARRVTSSEGIEMYPRFSPDGSKIAFSGEYDGNREVYLIDSKGGSPDRLTYSMDIQGLPERMGPDKIIMQWTSDGKNILYRSRHESWHAWVGKLYFVSPDGGVPEQLPLPDGGYASLWEDKSKIAYNRIFREYRTWKRYRGGQADDIWIYDFKTKELKNITENPAQDIIPMKRGDKVYYISDRDGRMNLYAYDLKSGNTKKITNFTDYDVKFPSLGADHIAFSNGGYVYLTDIATETTKKIDIQIAEDFPGVRSSYENVGGKIASYEISPDGKRALFSARGDIFSVPADKGMTKNLTETPGVHERNPKWSPDGEWIAFVSDESGEDEVYVVKPDGSGKKQLTKNAKSYRFELKWSPDSKKLLNADKAMRLCVIDIEKGGEKEIAKSKAWEIRDFTWSPDGKWVAYTDYAKNEIRVIYLYSLENGETYQATDEFFNSSSPAFTPDGKYLLFASNRTFNPTTGGLEWNYTYNNMTKIYGATLDASLENPFAEYDGDEAAKEKDNSDKKDDKKDDDKSKDIKIDAKGLKDRVFEFPISAANYGNIKALSNGKVYYSKYISGHRADLMVFDICEEKEEKAGDFGGYEISADEKKIIFGKNGSYYIENVASKIEPKEGKVDVGDMTLKVDRFAEWKQIFDESWRQMKHFFYDPNMHGVDWDAVHDKYAAMIPHLKHRDDLIYIIGEMIGELNVGHAYTGGGDMPKVEKVGIGLLGAEFELDKSGYYKFAKILEGRNWDEATRSPLTEPGLDVDEGDYLIAVDGEELSDEFSPFQALVGKAKEFVKLTVNSKPSKSGARDIYVKTIASETRLRYFNWVENNRRKVEEATDGRVGYIHIPDMMPDNGLNEFVKYYYPQIRKEALIIDDRYNGGGNVSQMIINRLNRELTMAKNARNQQVVGTYPDAVSTGPMVCLINELSASDGDIFPYQFRKNGLGKLIGKRSWGGVIGIRGSLPFIDGGYLYKPEFANFGADGEWIIEGVGTVPDIEVDNHPAKLLQGEDQQLNKAIEAILDELKNYDGTRIPKVPPYPIKK